MGLTLAGSLVWALGLAASFAWPGLVAIAYARVRLTQIPDTGRFLRIGIPLSYAVIFCAHGLLADMVLVGAERAVELGSLWLVWWRLGFVLMLETALAAAALFFLQRKLCGGAA